LSAVRYSLFSIFAATLRNPRTLFIYLCYVPQEYVIGLEVHTCRKHALWKWQYAEATM